MKMRYILIGVVMILAAFGPQVLAEDSTQVQTPENSGGAPPEMKELDYLIGDWDVNTKIHAMDTGDIWIELNGVKTYSSILGGCALQSIFKGIYEGKPYTELGIESYDRQSGKWQSTSIDDLDARVMIMTGDKQRKTYVEKMGGTDIITEVTVISKTPTQFEWRMAYSMDGGKTYMLVSTAIYNKKL